MACNGCENGARSAAWLISSVTVVVAAGLAAQLYFLVTCGSTHEYSALYVCLCVTLLVYSLVSLWLVRQGKHVSGVTICAWAGLVSVLGMVAADAKIELGLPHAARDFPGILYMLSLGVFSLASIVGTRATIPYMSVSVLASCIIGHLYGKTDDAVMAVVLPIAFFMLGREFSRMHHQLCRLRQAIRIVNSAEVEVLNGRANGRAGRD